MPAAIADLASDLLIPAPMELQNPIAVARALDARFERRRYFNRLAAEGAADRARRLEAD